MFVERKKWSDTEKARFLEGIEMYGKNYSVISKHVNTGRNFK